MAMHDKTEDCVVEDILAPYLAAAGAPVAAPADDFLARLVADAEAVQPAAHVFTPEAALPRAGFMTRLADFWRTLGGVPALSAFAAAVVAGFWFGLAPPAAVADALPLWPESDMGIGFYDEGEILALLEDE